MNSPQAAAGFPGSCCHLAGSETLIPGPVRLHHRDETRTGSGCDIASMLEDQNFAHVGPNADQTFVQNC